MSRVRRGSVSTLVPVVILVIVALLLVVWLNRPGRGLEREREAHGEVLGTMTGLARPVTNRLAAEYVDANGDLVADIPTDLSKRLNPTELVFTYIASEQNVGNATVFKPMMDAIGKATGRPVRFLPLSDLDEQLSAMHGGTLHICAFNTGAVPIAVDAAGFVPVASLGGDSGPQTYLLNLVASASSGIKDVNGIRGEEIALTEMGSNSGFKAPLVLLNQKFGFMPGRDFAIRYSGGHQESIRGLADNTYRVIAVASDVLAREERAGTIKPADYRVLYTSDPFPTAVFGYNHALAPELASQIESALTQFAFTGNSVGEHFAASGQTKLVKTTYANDFKLVRQIDDSIGYQHILKPAARAESSGASTKPTAVATPAPTTAPAQ